MNFRFFGAGHGTEAYALAHWLQQFALQMIFCINSTYGKEARWCITEQSIGIFTNQVQPCTMSKRRLTGDGKPAGAP